MFKETTLITEAERLQKSGWTLLAAVIVGTDDQGMTIKKYKFQKEANKAKKQKHIFQDPFSGKEITDEMAK